jgi:type II secretory pathway component PulL
MVPVEGVAVLIDGSDLCVKEGKIVTVCRSFSPAGGTGGLRHTLKSLGADLSTRVEKAVLLSANEGLRPELDSLGIAVEQIAPDFHGKKPIDPISLGLALSDQTNLRKGDFSYRHADVGIRRRRRTLIVAGASALLFAAVNLGVKSYLVQASYGKLDREIKEIYRQTVPDAKAVGDPVRQLRTKLEESKKKFGVLGSGISALDVMKAVTEGVPKEVRASFQDFLFENGVVKLQGEASSFESVDKMKAEFQKSPLFAEVVVQDTRMGVDNKVKFRFEIKVKQAQ